MITRPELARIAELKRLSLRNAERDYLLEHMLYSTSGFRRFLVFKGGSALYKFYNLNRFSEDLDFDIVGRRFDPSALVKHVLRNLERVGIARATSEEEEHRNEINIRFTVTGPLYDGSRASLSRIALNFSKRERPTSASEMLLAASYPEIPSFELFVLGAGEIAAEKIRAIMTREKPRDVYDLWFLIKRGAEVDRSLVNRKLKIYGLEFHPKTFREKLRQKHKMWDRDLKDLIIGTLPKFEHIANELEAECEKLT